MAHRYNLTPEGDVFLELTEDGRLLYTGQWVHGSTVCNHDVQRYSNGALYVIIEHMRDNDANDELIAGRSLTEFAILVFELLGGTAMGSDPVPHVVSAALLCGLEVPAALLEA